MNGTRPCSAVTSVMVNSHSTDGVTSDPSQAIMLRAELEEARQALDRLQADYEAAVTDSSVIQEDRDSLRALVEQARTHHAKAQEAVSRLDSGSYGICESCGNAISPERLEAIPSATTCRDCSS